MYRAPKTSAAVVLKLATCVFTQFLDLSFDATYDPPSTQSKPPTYIDARAGVTSRQLKFIFSTLSLILSFFFFLIK